MDLAANVELLHLVVKVGDSGVRNIVGAEDIDRLLDLVGLVDIVDYKIG